MPKTSESGGVAHPLGLLVQAHFPPFARARGDTPVSVLYLTIRAARRAIAINPRDAQAYAILGEAYLRLLDNSREGYWGRSLAQIVQLRHVQAAAAFVQALAIDPTNARAHLQLGNLYSETGFMDLALKHEREYYAAVQRAGPARGTRPEDHRSAMNQALAELDRRARLVDAQEDKFARESAGQRVYDRALLALNLGLAGKARDILLGSDIAAFGPTGLSLELELLIRTGRVQEVREWLAVEHQEALGTLYHWLRIEAFAAGGDYALAREECNRLAGAGLDPSSGDSPRAPVRDIAAARIALAVLDGQRATEGRTTPVWDAFRQNDFRALIGQLVATLRREADFLTLRGLLALEQGESVAAADDFRRALSAWRSPEAARAGSGIDFSGRLAAQQALDWIESVPAGRDR
jgi:TPR repeat